ncbi:hypothetical protein GCM10009751_05340 [Myceligenerans crystallogenes]|uniref:Uncharacterized protein n=1 Tax=Myceligenerans crystallogenes TaxID=316335 RepID=A0ABN2N4P5_9MICO
MSLDLVRREPAGITSRAPGSRADSAARRDAVKGTARDGAAPRSARGAHRDMTKSLKARERGRCERLAPRSSMDWADEVVFSLIPSVSHHAVALTTTGLAAGCGPAAGQAGTTALSRGNKLGE